MKMLWLEKLPDWVRFPLVLTVVTSISAASLAGLWALTRPAKLAIEARHMQEAFKVVMPLANAFEPKEVEVGGESFTYHLAKRGDGLVGYVAIGGAPGYSSIIKVMVGVKPNFQIEGITVLSQKETPGLGDKIEERLSKKTWWTVLTGTSPDESTLRPWFQLQFIGRDLPLKVEKDGGRIESVTGATISSRAVCDAVNAAVEDLKQALAHAEQNAALSPTS